MKLRTWHLAAALCVSLALHAGAAGVYLSGDEPALMAGGSPAVSAEIGEVFADMASEQHTVRFDFDEQVLARGITLFSAIVYDLAGRA